MKALLVLEDKEKLSLLNKKLTETGYDTICYQWLLKALDNIEEIAPHLIFISAIDYPRHWKTFVQHVRTHFSAEDTAIFLISPSLNQDEVEKSKILGIKYIISDIETDFENVIQSLKSNNDEKITLETNEFINQEKEPKQEFKEESQTEKKLEIEVVENITEKSEENFKIQKSLDSDTSPLEEKIPLTEEKTKIIKENREQKKIVTSCDFLVVNPSTNRIISGKVKKYKYPTIIFLPKNQEEITSLRFGQIFETSILKQVVNNQELSSSHRCQIRGFTEDSIEFCLLR